MDKREIDLLSDLLSANAKQNQSVVRKVEDNLQRDATVARLAVVDMLNELWETVERSDSYTLLNTATRLERRYGKYREPFYYETAEHKQRMEDIDNGKF